MNDAYAVDDEAWDLEADAAIVDFIIQVEGFFHLRVTPLDAVNGVAVRKQQIHADGSRGNGRRIQAPVDAAERIVLAVASGQAGREELVGWLEEYITMADTNRVNCDAYYACDPPLQSFW